jgi:hypothetical protein
MSEILDNSIILTGDDGKDETWKILFYYENPERKKTFYFIFKEADPDNLVVLTSSDGKTLEEPNEEEMDEASEMLDTYQNDPKIEEIK